LTTIARTVPNTVWLFVASRSTPRFTTASATTPATPPPVDDVLSEAASDDPDRGLYFICIAGNIARQFELVQHTWVNNPTFNGLYDEADPLIANHLTGAANFTIPTEPVRERYHDIPQFVTVKGGAYFFLPGIRALRYLATLP